MNEQASTEERLKEIEEHGSLPAQHIRRRQLIAYLMIVIAAIVGFLILRHQQNQINANQEANRQALCAVRGDLERRIESTKQFLAHPEQFPQFNDPKLLALTRSQVAGQQSTVDALSGISCPP